MDSKLANRFSYIVVLDFDGTITYDDIGDALCEQFADPSWREIDRLWEQGQLSLDDAQRAMWATFRASPAQINTWLSTHVRLRDGLDTLIETCAAHRIGLILASGGFDHYIRQILGDRYHRFEAIFCNQLQFARDLTVEVAFPHKETFGCTRCAVCKGKICAHYAQHAEVIFVGDGTSDRCALDQPIRVFGVRDSKLHREAQRRGRPVTVFDSFLEIVGEIPIHHQSDS